MIMIQGDKNSDKHFMPYGRTTIAERIAMIGGGGWGLTLAKLLAEVGHEVLVWEHNPDFVKILSEQNSNPILLPDIVLPTSIRYTSAISEVHDHYPRILVLATPAQFLRGVLRLLCQPVFPHTIDSIVNVAKGIEEDSLLLLSDVIREELPEWTHDRIFCLSGPSHSEEVARHIPTTVVIAGNDEVRTGKLQQLFNTHYFRVYRSYDLTGVQIGGAVKNVIAIAAGIIDGLGFGDNTKGALITRGIVEIERLGLSLNARPETLHGLSGIGDLVTTAFSRHSRNRNLGYRLGRGEKLPEILASTQMVVEGVATTRSVMMLAQRQRVEMPIVEQVYQVIYQGKSPALALRELMSRDLKPE